MTASVTAPPFASKRWRVHVGSALIALLACNAAVYAYQGSPSEALDSCAWLLLLVLFHLETARGLTQHPPRWTRVARALRAAAAVGIAVAAVGYATTAEWLDTANTALWIAVVAALEVEVYFPRFAARFGAVLLALTATLFATLAGLAAAWAWLGLWFDAYDAALWLIAFALLEVDVLQSMRIRRDPGRLVRPRQFG